MVALREDLLPQASHPFLASRPGYSENMTDRSYPSSGILQYLGLSATFFITETTTLHGNCLWILAASN
jgi:hypothetical protein